MQNMNDEKLINDVFLTLKKYIYESQNHSHVVQPESAENLKKILPLLDKKGVSSQELVSELQVILDNSVRTIHPLFLNQLFGGFDAASWAGEIASTLLNPTMATFEIAPMLTVIEKRMVKELVELLGFHSGEGIMVTGGSNSNLLAMLCARTDFNPGIRLSGFTHNNFRVYVSAEAHYSFDKAANITGIGTQNLIQIPCNERGEMIPEELERTIASDIKEGFRPLMVGATAGTTVLGAFDPLEKIAEICENHQIWMHVDAAWGGGALFSQSARGMLKGVEYADSVTFDAHKTLGTGLVTSFFLTKNSGILKNTNRGGGSEYLFHEYDNSEWDTGTYSLQCGRRADALKLWLLWRYHGTDGLTKRTEHLLELARFAEQEILTQERFKLIHGNYLNVCFQVRSLRDTENSSSFTLKVRQELLRSGKAMVNYAQRPDGTIFFRLVFPNHGTQKSHISQLLKEILGIAEELDLMGSDQRPLH